MAYLWLASVLVIAVGYILKDREVGRLKARLLEMRSYENNRNFRCQLAHEREDAVRNNDPVAFEKRFDHLGYGLSHLHAMADQGDLEAAGRWPAQF